MASRRARAVKARVPRSVPDVPGTVEPAHRDAAIVELPLSEELVAFWIRNLGTHPTEVGMRRFAMGECNILVSSSEPLGPRGEPRWHLTISTPHRHPTWDEIKTARYRLLPLDKWFALLLPPPAEYVNAPSQDHVFQVHEVDDPAQPGTLV